VATITGFCITGIECAPVAIVAGVGTVYTSDCGKTDIERALVAVVAIHLIVRAIADIRVTGVDCAWVPVIAFQSEIYAGSGRRLADVLCTGTVIITVDVGKGAVPCHRSAAVQRTGISVYAGLVHVRA